VCILFSKRLYQPILISQNKNMNEVMSQQMLAGYRNSCMLLSESYQYLNDQEKSRIFLQRAKILTVTKQLPEVDVDAVELQLY